MFGVTLRQRVLAAIVLVMSGAVAVAALVGWDEGALAGIAMLLGFGLILLLDLRRRLGDTWMLARDAARDQRKTARRAPWISVSQGQKLAEKERRALAATVAREIAAHERRLLAAIESGRLDDLDGFEALRTELSDLRQDGRLSSTVGDDTR